MLDCSFYDDENKEFNVESASRDFKSYVKDKEDLFSADLVRSTSCVWFYLFVVMLVFILNI